MRGIALFVLLCLTGLVAGQEVDTCFISSPIPDSVFVRMQGKSFKRNCSVSRYELSYLRLSYRDAEGKTQQGEMVCYNGIAKDLVAIFRELWKADYRIERMQLIDDFDGDDQRSMEANNTSCFNFRYISGTKTVSKHGTGMAVDVNPLYNPYVTKGKVEPASGKKWAYNRDKRNDIPYKIDRNDLCYKLFRQHGFRWGGDWRFYKDYQHFER